MASFFRRLTKRFFIITNIVVAALLLLACANTFLNPGSWWIVALLGLLFPLLILLVFGFLIFWILLGSRWTFLSLLTLILSLPNILSFYAWNFNADFKADKQESIRILTWNVHYFDQMFRPGQQHQSQRIPIINFLKQQDADILCLQEFFESNSPQYDSNINYIKENLNYPYHYFVDDYRLPHNRYKVGPVIFSKYRILQTNRMEYRDSTQTRASESLISADLDLNGDTIRIYTTHLQSVMFKRRDYQYIEKIKNVEDSLLEASKSIVKKLRQAYSIRGSQAEAVRNELNKSSYPSILCGDFNDVPNSYTYFQIKGNWQDAFLRKGAGIGRTYASISPTLRIDYILADNDFKILQCKKTELSYSDHYPVIADFVLKKRG